MIPQPPKWADRFLEWFCHPDLVEDLQGDLYEIYMHHHETGATKKANWLYCWLVLRSLRWSALKQDYKIKNSLLDMTRNNLKIAIRVLWRDKFNSSLNLLGLTLGITCFLLLGLYVKQELSYDHMHSKKDRIYRVWVKEDYGEGRFFFNTHTPLRFESLLEENFPEMERVVQLTKRRYLVGRGDNRINESVAMISDDFFKVFDFPLVMGNKENPLPTKNDMVISESMAKKYFGIEDPIGQTVSLQMDSTIRDFTVSAVFEDMPKESSIQLDMAYSTANGRDIFGDRAYTAWFNVIAETYVLVNENNDISTVDEKMQDVIMVQMADAQYGDQSIERDQYNIGFQPLLDIHLNPDIPLGFAPVSNPQYVAILGAIALLVLIAACINYATISAGQSLKRSREVGIRKVLGAKKRGLIYQYLSESLVLAIIAMILGTIATLLLIPTFNNLTGTEIYYQFEWWHSGAFFAIGLIIGLIAGGYPAFLLSAFKTIRILNGDNTSTGKMAARKGLVVLQFLVTVFLISSVFVMKDQLDYLVDKDLGFDYEAVITARMPVAPNAQGLMGRIESGMHNAEMLKSALSQYPEVSNIAMASHVFGSNEWTHLAFEDNKGAFKWFRLLIVNPEYLPAFNIEVADGRLFEKGNGMDERQGVILNEAAVKYFDLKDPIGGKLPSEEFGEHQIIGVVKDFNYSSLHTKIEPLVIVQDPRPIFPAISDADIKDSPTPKIVFTYSGNNLTNGMELLKKEWNQLFPDENMNYRFVDESIKAQYESEARMNKLISIATVLSVMIAGLGLFGLIMIVANSKIKEIGIRKVMGADRLEIFRILVKGFTIELAIAIVLSVPLTLWMMNSWLDNFAYRITPSPISFVLSALVTFVVASMVIVYHAVRASKVNPIDSLRVE